MNWLPFIERRDWLERSVGAIAVYENGEYIVEKRPCHPDNNMDFRLAIKRFDKQPIHRWSDFQRIKNEIAGPERIALEVYPAESELTDTANIYHLWVLYEGDKLPFTLSAPHTSDEPGVTQENAARDGVRRAF